MAQARLQDTRPASRRHGCRAESKNAYLTAYVLFRRNVRFARGRAQRARKPRTARKMCACVADACMSCKRTPSIVQVASVCAHHTPILCVVHKLCA
eukprot:6212746-Pleurochrysis_carterae.AAC.1